MPLIIGAPVTAARPVLTWGSSAARSVGGAGVTAPVSFGRDAMPFEVERVMPLHPAGLVSSGLQLQRGL